MMTIGRRKVSNCLMALTATCMALSTAAFAAEGHFVRTLQVTGTVDLDIHTGSGDISVRTGGNSTVEIRGTIRARGGFFSSEDAGKRVSYLESHPPIEQQGNTIKVGSFVEPHMQHNVTINYELTVPPNTRLASSTGSGDLAVDGISGELEASTGSGDIRVSNIGSSVQATAGSGQIVLETVKGGVRASTGSGDIQATGIVGGVRASAGSGDVTVEQNGIGEVHVNTSSGDIVLKGAQGLVHAKTVSGSISAEGGGQSPWYLEAVSGDVSVRVPPHLGFDLRAHTVSGSISTSQPLTLVGTKSKREITGKAGRGGFLLDLSTVSGDIQIDWMV